MGLFNSYLKEGPGVDKNAPKKHRFFLFFELFFRKLGKLIQLNVIYAITLLPLVVGLLLSLDINPAIMSDGVLITENLAKYPLIVFTGDIAGLILLVISIITGPATAGFTYVIRNFQREEHAWVLSDFWDRFKNNFKQGVLMSLLDFAAAIVFYIAIVFYVFMAKDLVPQIAPAVPYLTATICIFAVIYVWMHYYIYLLMVTFKLKFMHILKNAFIFAFAKLPLNILISVIVFAIVYFSLYNVFLCAIASFFILLSLIGYIIIFSVYPTVDKYLLKPAQQINNVDISEYNEGNEDVDISADNEGNENND